MSELDRMLENLGLDIDTSIFEIEKPKKLITPKIRDGRCKDFIPLEEVSKFINNRRLTLKEYRIKRDWKTMPDPNEFPRVYDTTFGSVRKWMKQKKRIKSSNKILYISEENLIKFIKKHTLKSRALYNEKRIRNRMPCAPKIKNVYGKSFMYFKRRAFGDC